LKTLRHAADISFWDKSGSSFMGLTRKNAKRLAVVVIALGAGMASPPIFPDPTDFINIWMAKQITSMFGIAPLTALTLTYTVIAWSILYLGFWIYPHSTEKIMSGFITKIKRLIIKCKRNPLCLGGAVLLGYFVFKWYMTLL